MKEKCSKCNGCNKSRNIRLVQKRIDIEDLLNNFDNDKIIEVKEILLKNRGIEDIKINLNDNIIIVCYDDIIINLGQINKKISTIIS